MKKFTSFISLIILSAVAFYSCGNKNKPTEIKDLTTYNDNIAKYSIKYPSNWVAKQAPMSISIYNTTDGLRRFIQYDTKGASAAKVEFSWIKMDTFSLEQVIERFKKFAPETYSAPTKLKIDGADVTCFKYTFELEDGPFNGEAYFAVKDSGIASVLVFEAFGGTFEAYKEKFSEILSSVKFAVKPVEAAADTSKKEADPPSETLRTISGDGYTIQIPDNFSRDKGFYIGERRGDSYIRVDIIDASKQSNLDKIVNDSKANFPGSTEPKDVSISGQKGKLIYYNPSSSVAGEVIFVIKGAKLYRITINWFKGEEAMFKPIFQKCVQTFKFQ